MVTIVTSQKPKPNTAMFFSRLILGISFFLCLSNLGYSQKQNKSQYQDKLIRFKDVKTHQYGIKDSLNNIIIPAEYDFIRQYLSEDLVFKVKKDGKYGIIDQNRKEIIPIQYKYFKGGANKGLKILKNMNNKFGVFDLKGRDLIPMVYDELKSSFDSTFIFRKDSQYEGVININNEIIIPNKYDEIKNKYQTYAYLKDGKWGLFSNDGELLSRNEYTSISSFSPDLLKLEKDGQYGLLEIATLKMIIPIEYTSIDIFSEDYIKIKKENSYGLYSLADQKTIMPLEFQNIWKFSETFAKIKKGNKYGLYNFRLKKYGVPILYDRISDYENGNMIVELEDKYGIIDSMNRSILDLQELKIKDHHNGLAMVKKYTKNETETGYSYRNRFNIYKDNQLLFPEFINEPQAYDHDLWTQNKNPESDVYEYKTEFDEFYFFHNGKISYRLPYSKSMSHSFNKGLEVLTLKTNDKWGLYEINGKELLSPKYEEEIKYCSFTFTNPLNPPRYYKVKLNGLYGIVNEKEDEIIPLQYEKMVFVEYGWIVQEKSKYGFILLDDQEMTIPPMYDSAQEKFDRLICEVNGKFGVVDYFNEIKVPFEYDSIKEFTIGFPSIFLARKDDYIELYDHQFNKITHEKYIDVQKIDHKTLLLRTDTKTQEVLYEDLYLWQFQN